MPPRYVTTAVAAHELGLGRNTLSGWARRGLVTPAYVTPGGQNRWDLDDLRQQLGAKETIMPEPATRPEPQPIVAAIVTSKLGVLVTRRNDGKPPWGFVTGEIEPGESPADAGVREVKEETGLLVRAGHEIGRRVHPGTGRTTVYMAASPTHGTKVFVGDENELAEVRWASLAKCDELMQPPFTMFDAVHDYLTGKLAH